MGRAFIAGLMMTMAGAVVAQETVAPAPTQALSKSPGVVVFPAQGQNAQQQSQDQGECYVWAKTDTGVDPMAATAPPPPPAERLQRVRSVPDHSSPCNQEMLHEH